MKTTRLSKLPIAPEENGIAFQPVHSPMDRRWKEQDMKPIERMFVSGLIRYYEPQSILEVGVAWGEGSACILNTIQDMDTNLTSVDVTKCFIHPFQGPVEVGEAARIEFPDLPEGKWRLFLEKDPADRMEEIGEQFDFLVLDTHHGHPCEVLNFLCILPFLKDGAIVVLHDVSLFLEECTRTGVPCCLAPRILLSTVAAEKYMPQFGKFSNIAAFQVTADTRKYIDSVFSATKIPWEMGWEYFPNFIKPVAGFIQRNYPAELQRIFLDAVETNLRILFLKGQLPDEIVRKIEREAPIFYGARDNLASILRSLHTHETSFHGLIWDIKADSIQEINGHPVFYPDFQSTAKPGQVLIVTLDAGYVYQEVCGSFTQLGYTVFHGIVEYLFPQIREKGSCR